MAQKVYIIFVIGSCSDMGEVPHPQTTKSLHVFSASPSPSGLCQCWKTSCTMQTRATTARFNPTATDGLCTSHSPAYRGIHFQVAKKAEQQFRLHKRGQRPRALRSQTRQGKQLN